MALQVKRACEWVWRREEGVLVNGCKAMQWLRCVQRKGKPGGIEVEKRSKQVLRPVGQRSSLYTPPDG